MRNSSQYKGHCPIHSWHVCETQPRCFATNFEMIIMLHPTCPLFLCSSSVVSPSVVSPSLPVDVYPSCITRLSLHRSLPDQLFWPVSPKNDVCAYSEISRFRLRLIDSQNVAKGRVKSLLERCSHARIERSWSTIVVSSVVPLRFFPRLSRRTH